MQDHFRPRPVERLEVDEGPVSKGRLAAVLLLAAVGVSFLVYSIAQLLIPPAGWQTVQAAGLSSGSEFSFLYNSASSKEAKGVKTVYTRACQESYQLFNSGEAFEGVVNLASINRHPNEALEVDPALYEALAAFAERGRRELYLGPIYERYEGLFTCEDDSQLVYYDPRLSEEVREEYDEVLSFANDPQAIDLELLGEGRVRLKVSPEYLAWAGERGVTRFLDFSWMKNAFVADYLAQELMAAGYTSGTLSSRDGFFRTLDGSGADYTYTIHHRRSDGICPAANLHYQGPMAIVRMRDFPLAEGDLLSYRSLPGGEVRTRYLDPADALCKSAVDNLICYDREMGCVQLLMEMIPVYITGEPFGREEAAALAARGVDAVFCEDSVVCYTDPQAVLTDLMDLTEEGGVRYTVELVGP